jgi:hypothetical protein
MITVGAAALGWLLGEASQFMKGRRQHREAIGLALVEVLALWRDFRVMEIVNGIIGDRSDLSKDEACVVIQDLLNDRQSTVDLRARLEPTVSCLASIDPLLALEVRAKVASAEAIIDFLRESPASLLDRSGAKFIQLAKQPLQRVGRLIARRHGIRTRLRVFFLFLAQGYGQGLGDLEVLLSEIEPRSLNEDRMRRWRTLSEELPLENLWADGSLAEKIGRALEEKALRADDHEGENV